MRQYKLYQVDSFTTEKFTGNPAGVVLDADGLSEAEMLKIARELNNSETAFVFSPDDTDHDVRIRYFTPTVEVPVCGHATIAAHYVRALENNLPACTVMHKIQIGTLPVEVIPQKNDYKIMMTQGKVEFGLVLVDARRAALLAALGLQESDMDERCPIEIVSTGHSKVMIGIRARQTLDQLQPDMAALTEISRQIGCNGFFVFTLDAQIPGILTHGRMFAPAIGIMEDPVTGNANGPLGAYLIAHHLVEHDGRFFQFKGEQGSAIGRSGIVEVVVAVENGAPIQVKIGGPAVVVFATTLTLPV